MCYLNGHLLDIMDIYRTYFGQVGHKRGETGIKGALKGQNIEEEKNQ